MSVSVSLGHGVRADEQKIQEIFRKCGIKEARVLVVKKGNLVYYETTVELQGDYRVTETDHDLYRSATKAADRAAKNAVTKPPLV